MPKLTRKRIEAKISAYKEVIEYLEFVGHLEDSESPELIERIKLSEKLESELYRWIKRIKPKYGHLFDLEVR